MPIPNFSINMFFKIFWRWRIIMTRPELIVVLSFVPGFTTDILAGLPSERLVELYSDYFEG
jgi:hypothetical protein